MAKSSKAANVRVTTTTTTTEATTATETTTETTTVEVFTNEDGTPMSDREIAAYKIVKKTPNVGANTIIKPKVEDTFEETDGYIKSNRCFSFATGDSYNIMRYEFKAGNTQPLTNLIHIPGSSIEIRYVDDNDQWKMTTDLNNVSKKTLFINTDKCSAVVGIPGVYRDSYVNNTLEVLPDEEKPVTITKVADGYNISYNFAGKYGTIGEIWYLYSDGKLADWTNAEHFKILKQDMDKTHRIAFDGYYYPVPYNYHPYGERMLYRQPSNYVGALFVRNGYFPAANELGYVLTYTCMKNQNVQGYWATGPQSDWLTTDFNIGAGFYDTRFNTDFAVNLLESYKKYGSEEFLFAAVKYAEYYKEHARNNSYKTVYGGVLVEDYGSYSGNHIKTHVSLNHHLAEMNFLYELYDVTGEETYLQLADTMLKGIEDTKDQWVLQDNNLNYALYYTGTYNTMKDYPYLTYNDLFTTKKILNKYFNKSNATIEYLMACKLDWMQKNNVTGYYTE